MASGESRYTGRPGEAPGIASDAFPRAQPQQSGPQHTDQPHYGQQYFDQHQHVRSSSDNPNDDPLVHGLGWFSNGLGVAGVAKPSELARFIGVEDDDANRAFLRLVGLREIASGFGILSQPHPTGWIWARVAGDVMDMSYLGWSLLSTNAARRNRTMAALASVAGVTALDLYCSLQLSQGLGKHGMHVTKSITINRPIDEVYTFWRNFENLPRIMSHLQSVQVIGERQSHWKTKGPADSFVEWDAVIVADTPNEIIAWQSLEGADIPNRGSVRFRLAPGGRGTEITVELDFEAPGGSLGRTFAKLFGKDPAQQIASDLRRLKQLLETGEMMRSEATVAGSGLIQRPAQPTGTTQQHAA